MFIKTFTKIQKLYCYVVIFTSSRPDKIIMTYHRVNLRIKVFSAIFVFVYIYSTKEIISYHNINFTMTEMTPTDFLIEEEEFFCEWNTHWKGNTKSGKVETLFFIDTALHRDENQR